MFSAAPGEVPAGSLLREGAAMFASLAEDFARLPDTEVVALHDARLATTRSSGVDCHSVTSAEDESARFDSLAATADWTIVIAPEFDEHLLKRTRRVEELGGRLLSPDSRIVELGISFGIPLQPVPQLLLRLGRLNRKVEFPSDQLLPMVAPLRTLSSLLGHGMQDYDNASWLELKESKGSVRRHTRNKRC